LFSSNLLVVPNRELLVAIATRHSEYDLLRAIRNSLALDAAAGTVGDARRS